MKTKPDWLLILIYIIMICVGWFSIYATSYQPDSFTMKSQYGYQLIWIGISLLLALFSYVLTQNVYKNISLILYILFSLMLVAVIFVGAEHKGAKSWVGIGNIGIQPAEFAKYATCLLVSKYVSDNNCNLTEWKYLWKVGLIIAIPIFIILLQNDTGSALPYIFLVFALFREGMSSWFLIIGSVAILLFCMLMYLPQWAVLLMVIGILIFLLVRNRKHKKTYKAIILIFIVVVSYVLSVDMIYNKVLQPHQKQRIELLFGKIDDPRGIGYNVNQAKIAIGSGGMWGKGFCSGTQTQLKYVPEQTTDFIFCTIGEEKGFVGTTFVIVLYMLLIGRIILLAEANQDAFVRVYGYCVACIFFAHFAINIGMTRGLMPVIGIPLPFISFGGSSLLAFTIMLFTFINVESKSHGYEVNPTGWSQWN